MVTLVWYFRVRVHRRVTISVGKYMGTIRNANANELAMLRRLIEPAAWEPSLEDWEERLKVQSMEDGGMGSFRIFPDGTASSQRIFGKEISSFSFLDDDGIEVVVSLNLDQKGDLFEVDVWKVDYSQVKRSPLEK